MLLVESGFFISPKAHLISCVETVEVYIEMKRNTRTDAAIIRWPQVQELTGYSRSTIFRLERAEKFPQRVRLGAKAVGWYRHEVIAWQERTFSRQVGAMPYEAFAANSKHKRRRNTTGRAV